MGPQMEALCWDVLLPRMRSALGSTWNPREYATAIELVEIWRPVLPGWVVANMLEQLVLPRLHRAVDAWDPRSDRVPLHAWLHPWLPLMGRLLDSLYPNIRYKLGMCLQVRYHQCAAISEEAV